MNDQKKLRKRTIIFCDALERGNPGIRDFLALLTNDGAANIEQNLRGVSSYLIFTSVASSLPAACATGIPVRMRPVLRDLKPELVQRGIEARIARFKQSAAPALAELVTDESIREIAERAGTVSRAARFITSQLVAVLRRETTVQKAFDELDDLSSWFQNSAGRDHSGSIEFNSFPQAPR